MREIATRVPIAELRLTLPRFLAHDRSGVLALLDVFVGADVDSDRSSDGRIFAIDYLITLLCTSGDGPPDAIRYDPVTLTPRLENLCAHAAASSDPSLAEIAADFFAASNMDAEDLREEMQQRRLRSRKSELGNAFFAPDVLRAIVTYNAALFQRITGQIIESGDWGMAERRGPDPASPASVYDSKPFREIAAATRRRANGDIAKPNPADRIAWALDFDDLGEAERKALRSDQLGTRADPLGTVILVGLVCRSLAVLSIDLQDVGISPDEVSDAWVAELTGSFQSEIDKHIANQNYKVACALQELKDRFLFAPLEGHLRTRTAGPPLPGPATASAPKEPVAPKHEKRESARDLVRDALEGERNSKRPEATEGFALSDLPWFRIAQAAAVVLCIGLGVHLLQSGKPADLARLSQEELASVSSYLTGGHRNGDGGGSAFVGTIDERWLALSASERQAAAQELVARLRERRIQQIMIYDDDRALRIQAIGSQPVRTL